MPNPWDAPPFPKRGNKTERALFESIGRALTAWENIEAFLASLFAALQGKDLTNREAHNEYGIEANFQGRLRALREAGDAYFVKRPNQALEGEFFSLLKEIEGWSARRNDVAHGLVCAMHLARDRSRTLLSGGPLEWCLVPPEFREAKYLDRNTPAHILTSREINAFAAAFFPVARRAHALTRAVELPQHALRRKRVVPPLSPP